MLLLKILSFLFLASGAILVYAARFFVKRFHLDDSVKCNFENEMNEEELNLYRYDKAVVNFKMLGMLVALPGLILLVVSK